MNTSFPKFKIFTMRGYILFWNKKNESNEMIKLWKTSRKAVDKFVSNENRTGREECKHTKKNKKQKRWRDWGALLTLRWCWLRALWRRRSGRPERFWWPVRWRGTSAGPDRPCAGWPTPRRRRPPPTTNRWLPPGTDSRAGSARCERPSPIQAAGSCFF